MLAVMEDFMVVSKKRGGALTKECPRSGFIRLMTITGQLVTVPTTCKTWSCVSCRDRIRNKIKKAIAYGCLTLGQCWLITLTYRTDGLSHRDADSVNRDWRQLCKNISKSYPEMAWFKIIEVTKQGEPHLHVVMGGLGGNAGRRELQKQVKRWWNQITGDSYIVNVKEVYGAFGAAAYLCKYLVKAMLVWDQLYELGFRRRWSKSNNWPVGYRALKGSDEGRWYRSQFVNGGSAEARKAAEESVASEKHPLRVVVGDPVVLEMEAKQRRRAIVSTMMRGVNHVDSR